MTRRVVIVDIVIDLLPLIVDRLPSGVSLAAKRDHFGRPWTEARFEGDGLPAWCDAPLFATEFTKAVACVASDGITYFIQTPNNKPLFAANEQHVEWFVKQFGLSN